jgi:polysaccharide export outer membrane protein
MKNLLHLKAIKYRFSFFMVMLGLITIGVTSCNSYEKVLYFQDLDKSGMHKEVINNYAPLSIQTEDILEINVSSLSPEASAVFSFSSSVGKSGASSGSQYLVDHSGEINFPMLGPLKVAGFTTSELREQLRSKLLSYLKEPIVNIRILNFKVSVIGDVVNPGVYNVPNEKITIPEVLSMAGDLQLSAKRNNVLLVREQDGHRQFIPIDLTKNIFQSPYYYLKNNDLIYVQPDKSKVGATSKTFNIVASALSLTAIVVQLLR